MGSRVDNFILQLSPRLDLYGLGQEVSEGETRAARIRQIEEDF